MAGTAGLSCLAGEARQCLRRRRERDRHTTSYDYNYPNCGRKFRVTGGKIDFHTRVPVPALLAPATNAKKQADEPRHV